MPSPILARADALMQRRYQSSADQSDLPILTDAIENDDDLPVLNDIANDSAPTQRAAIPADFNLQNKESDTFASELAHQVEQRILAQLPQLIDSAIKDLMAEREITAINQEHN
jgi:hypothetical protein